MTPMLVGWDFDPAGLDPAGWWASEKLDGIRGVWDGSALWTRKGIRLNPPAWWTAGLPPVALDGELTRGRGTFNAVAGLASTQNPEAWQGVRFAVFDAPEQAHVEDRLRKLLNVSLPAHAFLVPHVRCNGRTHLEIMLADVLDVGGEGLVLRQPGSTYWHGRSTSLVRYKPQETKQ